MGFRDKSVTMLTKRGARTDAMSGVLLYGKKKIAAETVIHKLCNNCRMFSSYISTKGSISEHHSFELERNRFKMKFPKNQFQKISLFQMSFFRYQSYQTYILLNVFGLTKI